MKKLLLIISISILALTEVKAQANIYHFFPDTNAFWGDKGWNLFNNNLNYNTRYGINGDTVISGKNYKKIYSLFDSTLTSPYSTYFAAIREQNKKVYSVIGNVPEQVLYDFNLQVGDTMHYYYTLFGNYAPDTFATVVTKIDSILLRDGKYRKRFSFAPATMNAIGDTVVEGIGSIEWRGLFNPYDNVRTTGGDEFQFTCFKQNDTALYINNPWCYRCFCTFTTGINETEKQSTAMICPNPFSNETSIRTNENLTNATLTVYNLMGQQVKQIKNITGQTITLQRDNLPGGLYFIRLTQYSKLITTDKIVITDN